MPSRPRIPKALAGLTQQVRVRDFLAAAVDEDRVSHAYLFLGAPGSGKLDAAFALAQCVVCPNGGDATCDECIRVSHRTHPDVHYLVPASVTGYLVQLQLTPFVARFALYLLPLKLLWTTWISITQNSF